MAESGTQRAAAEAENWRSAPECVCRGWGRGGVGWVGVSAEGILLQQMVRWLSGREGGVRDQPQQLAPAW